MARRDPGDPVTTTRYPPLIQRYLSTVIDGFVLLFVMVAVSVGLQGSDPTLRGVRIALVLGTFATYEPVLTSTAMTLGQLVTGIRVRHYDVPYERISIAQAYVRWVVKMLLGWFSFLTMGFNRERRAVHDLAARSVVVAREPQA
jgi:uncharacterized RDD family membrane protein YckC